MTDKPKGHNLYGVPGVTTHKRSGAAKGSQNSKVGKRWTQAIDKALKQYSAGDVRAGQALDAIAVRMVREALTSDDAALVKFCISEIGNRLDGKPTEHKVIDKSVTTEFGGLSEFAAILQKFAGFREADVIEGTLSDGPVLPAPVCLGSEGHGEGVGIPEVSGGSGESERSH